MHLSDHFVDIIREGFDVAIRIGELEDSSLVARKLAGETRVICAAPLYLEKAGTPRQLADLEAHNCLTAGAQDVWRLNGPDGAQELRVKGNIRSNSADFVRSALVQGLGIALRAVWDVGPEIERGELRVILPEYSGSSKNGIYAVYSCREFMPAKVNAFIEFLADLFAGDPHWDRLAPATGAADIDKQLKRAGKAMRA